VHSAVKNRHSRERHYGFACPSYKQQLELDLRYTQPGLPALRSKHDGISMSRILLQRLASGVGASDQRWIEEGRNSFWEIVLKASTVDKAARADGTFNERDERQRGNHGQC
jgi:hypothetical protein